MMDHKLFTDESLKTIMENKSEEEESAMVNLKIEHEQISKDYNKMIIKFEEMVKRHEKLQEENQKLKYEQ